MTDTVPARVLVALALTFVPMAVEAAYSRRQEARLRARGAVEPPDDVYPAMAWAYPGAFVAMTCEGWWWGRGIDAAFVAGVMVWGAGKALKYAAIRSLGPLWSFRVLVLPGAPLVARGPYRWLRHPNYVGIIGELVGTALMAFAPAAGPVCTLGFGWLLRRRVRVEERALGLR
jgi:methyltransferase